LSESEEADRRNGSDATKASLPKDLSFEKRGMDASFDASSRLLTLSCRRYFSPVLSRLDLKNTAIFLDSLFESDRTKRLPFDRLVGTSRRVLLSWNQVSAPSCFTLPYSFTLFSLSPFHRY